MPAIGARAATVAPGYDLFQTQSGTFFNNGVTDLFFLGMPLQTYDFGGSIGVQNVGQTDTIIQRLSAASVASVPNTASAINLAVDALHMVDSADSLYVTLQSERGGAASTGSMTISFDNTGTGGTFNSSLDVFFDIHSGSLSGTIVSSGEEQFTTSGSWTNTPSSPTIQIQDVNYRLDGSDTSQDFFTGELTELAPNAQHIVDPPPIPEPSSAGVLLTALAGLFGGQRRRARGN